MARQKNKNYTNYDNAMSLDDAYEIVGGYKKADKETYDLAFKYVEENDKDFADSLKKLRGDKNETLASSIFSIAEAYEIAGGYKPADEVKFAKAIEIIKKDDLAFALNLEIAHINDIPTATPEMIDSNATYLSNLFQNDTELKDEILTTDYVQTALDHTVVQKNNNSEVSSHDFRDVIFESSQLNVSERLTKSAEFYNLNDEDKRARVVDETSNEMVQNIKANRLATQMPENHQSEVEAIKTNDTDFFENLVNSCREALDINKDKKTTENIISKQLKKTKTKFLGFIKNITAKAKEAKGNIKKHLSHAAVSLNKISIYSMIMVTTLSGTSLTSCGENQKNHTEDHTKYGLSFTDTSANKKSKKDTITFDEALKQTQNKKDTVKVAPVDTTAVAAPQEEVDNFDATIAYNPSEHQNKFGKSQIVSDVDNLKVGTPAAGNIQVRGGYLNTGVTKRQYNNLKQFFRTENNANALDGIVNKIRNDGLTNKGNIFEGLSEIQAAFMMQSVIRWSGENGAYGDEVRAMKRYITGCDDHFSAEMSVKIRNAVNKVNTDGSMDGVIGTQNSEVKYIRMNDCDEALSYKVIENEGQVAQTNPTGEKFARFYEVEDEKRFARLTENKLPIASVDISKRLPEIQKNDNVAVMKNGKIKYHTQEKEVVENATKTPKNRDVYLASNSNETNSKADSSEKEGIKLKINGNDLGTGDQSKVLANAQKINNEDVYFQTTEEVADAPYKPLSTAKQLTPNEANSIRKILQVRSQRNKFNKDARRIMTIAYRDYAKNAELQRISRKLSEARTKDENTFLKKENQKKQKLEKLLKTPYEDLSRSERKIVDRHNELNKTIIQATDLLSSYNALVYNTQSNGR